MRMQKKRDLPTKICAQSGLPFAWRKKWERVWDEVKYCSERCRRERTGHHEFPANAQSSTMNSFWSPCIRELTPYIPGEQPRTGPLVKLNTNENPFGPASAVLAACAAAASDDLRLYPDPWVQASDTGLQAIS